MMTTLNIGLAVEGCRDVDPQEVVTRLRELFPGDLRGYRVEMSETERTLVVQLEQTDIYRDIGFEFTGIIYKLACMFGQDCIAVSFAGIPTGDLIGPAAKSWGKFDRRHFIDYR